MRQKCEPVPFDEELARAVEEVVGGTLFARPKEVCMVNWQCRRCGCTDARACPGGCSWVEKNLCSRCA